MNPLKTAPAKLGLAAALLVVLAVASSTGPWSASAIARGLLGVTGLGGLVFWMSRRKGRTGRFSLPPRLRVLERASLSPKCGLAWVEAEGQSYLIVFGEAFAEVRAVRRKSTRRGRAHSPQVLDVPEHPVESSLP